MRDAGSGIGAADFRPASVLVVLVGQVPYHRGPLFVLRALEMIQPSVGLHRKERKGRKECKDHGLGEFKRETRSSLPYPTHYKRCRPHNGQNRAIVLRTPIQNYSGSNYSRQNKANKDCRAGHCGYDIPNTPP